MNMKYAILITLITTLMLVACTTDSPDTDPTTQEPVFCTEEYAPVCGVDGQTYSNACVATQQHGVEIAYEGECTDMVACTREYAPVCGVDGQTYSNACVATQQHGVEIAYEGECTDMVACTMEYAPVCGVDGQTYGNACVATQQHGVEIAYEGECGSAIIRVVEQGIDPNNIQVQPGQSLTVINSRSGMIRISIPQFQILENIMEGSQYIITIPQDARSGIYPFELNNRQVATIVVNG